MTPEISNKALEVELAGATPPLLLDVRETHELVICRLPNVVHIPLGEIAHRIGELNPNTETVVVCRSGGRSAHVTDQLISNGFAKVRNLVGGMNGWAKDIDPTIPTY